MYLTTTPRTSPVQQQWMKSLKCLHFQPLSTIDKEHRCRWHKRLEVVMACWAKRLWKARHPQNAALSRGEEWWHVTAA